MPLLKYLVTYFLTLRLNPLSRFKFYLPRRSTPMLATATALLVILISCTPAPVPPLRLSTITWPGYENFYLAKALGYYEEVPIRLVNHASAASQIQAFLNREVEAAAVTMGDALVLAKTEPDLQAVLVLDISNGADVLLAKPDIQSLADLKGHPVGVEPSGLGAFMLSRALAQVGLVAGDVEIVPIGSSEHERAFKQGEVDAVITYEPIKTQLLLAGAKLLFDSSQIPGEIVDVLIVRQDLLTRQRQSVHDLVEGWFRAHDYATTHPQDAAQRAAQRQGLTVEQFLQSLEGLSFPGIQENRALLGKTDPALLQAAEQLVRILVENGTLQRAVDPKSLLNSSLVDQVQVAQQTEGASQEWLGGLGATGKAYSSQNTGIHRSAGGWRCERVVQLQASFPALCSIAA